MKTIKEKALSLRAKIEGLAESMDDTEALNYEGLFPKWKISLPYKKNDRVRFSEVLYKCLQDHTSQEDWTPDVAVSLWVAVSDPSVEFPEWKQPVGSQDAYSKEDKVSHNDKHWISLYDNNVWEPGVFGWNEV